MHTAHPCVRIIAHNGFTVQGVCAAFTWVCECGPLCAVVAHCRV